MLKTYLSTTFAIIDYFIEVNNRGRFDFVADYNPYCPGPRVKKKLGGCWRHRQMISCERSSKLRIIDRKKAILRITCLSSIKLMICFFPYTLGRSRDRLLRFSGSSALHLGGGFFHLPTVREWRGWRNPGLNNSQKQTRRFRSKTFASPANKWVLFLPHL